ncbi:MAG: NAD(P)H-dependent oxidoreductase [Myxococcales bacterium]|nr:NAD(P)H-dependent oxidoreductase [Myxococcales bacterium]
MKRRILVILGHPRSASLCSALATQYAEAAESAGAEVRVLRLGEMDFDPVLRDGFGGAQSLEPALEEAKDSIEWCEQLVIVTPLWWGDSPALLKGFFDRVLLPGWAFKYDKGMPVKLLKGRRALVIATMDSPAWWYRLFHRRSLESTLGRATLGFCGIKTRFHRLYNVRSSKPAQREQWLAQIARLAKRDAQA